MTTSSTSEMETTAAKTEEKISQSALTINLTKLTFKDWLEFANNFDYEPGWALRAWIRNYASHNEVSQEDLKEVASLFGSEASYILKRIEKGY
jgi:diadenosine tetraphosphate (Ap4A) HIT family hydrolase